MARNVSIICCCDDNVHAFSIAVRGDRPQVISEGKEAYQVPDSLFGPHDPAELVRASAKALQEANGSPGRAILILPMQWCFLQSLPKGSKKSDQALAFEFEPFLPLALEEVTCAFGRLSPETCVGVAIPTQPMGELLEHFEAAGIEIDHIAVDTLLAMDLQRQSGQPRSIMIKDARWLRGAFVDPLTDSFGSAVFAADEQAVKRLLVERLFHEERTAEQFIECSSTLQLANLPDSSRLQPKDPSAGGQPQHSNNIELTDLAKFAALHPPDVDLRTGELSGTRTTEEVYRVLRQCLGLAALLFVVISATLFLQNRTLLRHQGQIDAQKLEVYQKVFEASSLPPGAAMRLASERVRLEGLARTDVASSKQKEVVLPPPFVALRNIVEMIPNDVPVLLNETRIDEHHLSMRGQTREHRDAERIVEAINKVPGIKALAPRTNRLKAGGVEFAINAGADNGP